MKNRNTQRNNAPRFQPTSADVENGGSALLELVHYTARETVVEILGNGAFWHIPNDRAVLDRLLPDEGLEHWEPERFGAVSFTSVPVEAADHVRQDFGSYGIGVSESWARAVGAQPVIYVPGSGPALQAFRRLFESAVVGLRRQMVKDAGNPLAAKLIGSVPNKRIVGLLGEGALWSTLMTLFEHMEPADHAHQQEWRVVQHEPFHFSSESREGQLEEATRDEETWRLRQLEFGPDDVEKLVCPAGEENEFRDAVPSPYHRKRVEAY